LPEPVETVTIDECQRFQVVEEQLTALAQEMGTLSGSPVQITAAPGIQGVCLLVTASCDDAGVRKVAEVLAKKPNVSFVQVKRGSAVVYETGLDWKTYTTIAPVGSR
ncbi:MAG TPA: hypothetical protein VFF73_39785, partial [Planctomycetota bacterium]|nr:hypothetical protein [Planctomycetota bacterium]